MTTYNETATNLLNDYGIDPNHNSINLLRLSVADSRYLKDLKLNVSSVLGNSNMTRKEALLLALSVAINEKNVTLIEAFEDMARKEGASEAEIGETFACTSLMNANNVFYRFRHFMDGIDYYNNQPAGLRMSIMMNPVMGKGLFELMSLVISAVNGCQRCVTSHEHSVKEQGASEARIFDAIRLASVIKSLCVVI
ncbi:MAG TPA: carboxymuconolactone decarboxylase family protein [Flavipsychrobacter sp.]|nr:carboxymuconolactone decarboxylase family protein [Flavipsychrobacter sp.]